MMWWPGCIYLLKLTWSFAYFNAGVDKSFLELYYDFEVIIERLDY